MIQKIKYEESVPPGPASPGYRSVLVMKHVTPGLSVLSAIRDILSTLDIGHASLTISELHYVSRAPAGLINRQMFTVSPHFCHRGNIRHHGLTSHQIRFLRFAATNEKWKMLDLEQMDGGTID